jgi:D-alanyl-D-alanine dipeptidase
MGKKYGGSASFWILLVALLVMAGMWIFEQTLISKQIVDYKAKIGDLNFQNGVLSDNEIALKNEIKRLMNIAGGATGATPNPGAGQLIKDGFVNIQQFDPNIGVDLKYATPDNFTGKVIYNYTTCVLTVDTAKKLLKVSAQVQRDGFFLKIWDGYREPQASWDIWNTYPDPNFVSNPDIGDTHCRGVAVDLTIVDVTGKELEMPTAYDNFTDAASGAGASAEAYKNWQYLKRVMEQNGFVAYNKEWWHYDDSNKDNYVVTEIDVRTLFE